MRLALICLLSLSFLLPSCTKDLEHQNLMIELQLDSIIPSSARIGDTVTLFGHGFTGLSNPRIRINDDTAEIVGKTSDQIKFIVRYKFTGATVNLQSDSTFTQGPSIAYRYIANVTTVAGIGSEGFQDGPGSSAAFKCPWGLAFDKDGILLVADNYNHALRKIDLKQSEPYVSSTYLPSFQFYNPYNIAVDTTNNTIFITNFNTKICKIAGQADPVTFEVPTFKTTTGVAVGPDRRVYVGDNVEHKLYSMTQDAEDIQLVTDNVWTPRNIVFDEEGRLYTINSHVMEVLPGGDVKHFEQKPLLSGWEFAIDADGNFIQADHFTNQILKVDRATGKVTVIAGSGRAKDVDGVGLEASFNGPMSVVIDKSGNLYVSTYNFDTREGNNIRKITFE